MIIQTSIRQKSNSTKTASGAVNYVMGEIDGDGHKRTVKPVKIYGDPDLIRSYDKHPKMNKTNQSTSGVISLRDGEKLDKDQEQTLVKRFIQYTIPKEFRDKVDMLIVKHEDKSNTEYHFVIPHLTNEGKPFNPYGVIGRDRGQSAFQAAQSATKLLNAEFGFSQVIPGTAQKDGLTSIEKKGGFSNTTAKKNIAQVLTNDIKRLKIENRDQLIEHIKSKGATITRVGQDYISIKQKGSDKAMRLKGGYFSKDSSNAYKIATAHMPEKPKYTKEDYDKDKKVIQAFHNLLVDRYEGKQQNQWKLLAEFKNARADANNLDIKVGIDPSKLEPWQKQPEKLVENLLQKIDDKQIVSRDNLINHLKDKGFEVKMPTGDNRNYLDITFPNQSDSYRFAGSVFMEQSGWIYKQSQQGNFSVSKQLDYVDVYDMKSVDKAVSQNHNEVNSIVVMKDKELHSHFVEGATHKAEQTKATATPTTPTPDQPEQPQSAGQGLGGQVVGGGVAEAEAGLQVALSNVRAMEAQFGVGSPQAKQAAAAVQAAIQRVVQAHQAEAEQQNQQRKSYRAESTNNRKHKI